MNYMYNMTLTEPDRKKLKEVIDWAIKPHGWVSMSGDGYGFNLSRPKDPTDPHGIKDYMWVNFLELLIVAVAPALGLNTVTLDLANRYSLIDFIFERYDGYLNSEVGEENKNSSHG